MVSDNGLRRQPFVLMVSNSRYKNIKFKKYEIQLHNAFLQEREIIYFTFALLSHFSDNVYEKR